MADFDKIKINGVPYTVKDRATAQAVAQVESDLAKTKATVQQQGQQISQQGQAIAQQGQQIEEQRQQIEELRQDIEQNEILLAPEKNSDIASALETALAEGNVVLAPGNYKLSKTVTIPVGRTLDCNGSEITASTSMSYMFKLGTTPSYEGGGRDARTATRICNFALNCDIKASGILSNTQCAWIDHGIISNPITSGIDIYPDTVDAGNPSDNTVDTVYIMSPTLSYQIPYGVRLFGTDNNIARLRTLSTKVGVYMSKFGASLFLTDCHTVCYDSDITGWEDSVGYYLQSSAKICQCYSDNFRTAYYVEIPESDGNAKIQLVNCTNFYWEFNKNVDRYDVRVNATALPKLTVENFDHQEKAGIIRLYCPDADQLFFGALQFAKFSMSGNTLEPNMFNPDDLANLAYVNKQFDYMVYPEQGVDDVLLAMTGHYPLQQLPITLDIDNPNFSIRGLTVYQKWTESIVAWGTYQAVGTPSFKPTITIKQDSTGRIYIVMTGDSSRAYGCTMVHVNGPRACLVPRNPVWTRPETSDIASHQYTT